MKLTRHFPKDYDAILELVKKAVGDSKSVVLQAGHFVLYYDKDDGKIYPSIPSCLTESRHQNFKEAYGMFPMLTWDIGLRLLDALGAMHKHVLVLVNDWQYLPKSVSRDLFYSMQSGLPESYSEKLDAYRGEIHLLEPEPINDGVPTAPFFGEMNLRNRYRNRMADLVKSRKLPPNVKITEQNGKLSCTVPDLSGAHREVYCAGKTGDCAAEVAELISSSSSRTNATVFISLYPLVCKDFVELGSKHAVELLGATVTTVISIGFRSIDIQNEADLVSSAEITVQHFNGDLQS